MNQTQWAQAYSEGQLSVLDIQDILSDWKKREQTWMRVINMYAVYKTGDEKGDEEQWTPEEWIKYGEYLDRMEEEWLYQKTHGHR